MREKNDRGEKVQVSPVRGKRFKEKSRVRKDEINTLRKGRIFGQRRRLNRREIVVYYQFCVLDSC